MTMDVSPPVRYTDALESVRPDEEQLIDALIAKLHANNTWAHRHYGRAIRDAHAKTHGVLTGELSVYPDLPDPLRQGLFAAPARYPVAACLSSTSGALRDDRLSGIRGLGLKVLDVSGPRILADDHAATQDFLLVTHRSFPFADTHSYLKRGMPLAWLLARTPDWLMAVVQRLLRVAKPGVTALGGHYPAAVELFVEPNTHILGHTFYSSAPLRYGDYVAKVALAPLSPEVAALSGVPVAKGDGREAFRDKVVGFFERHGADYEMRVQLCTDTTTMPIEDATVEWPESQSPYVPVGRVSFPVQNPYSDGRVHFGDEVLSFNSWRGLAAHRPLGSINRLKLRVYQASSDFRHHTNHVTAREPANRAEIPD